MAAMIKSRPVRFSLMSMVVEILRIRPIPEIANRKTDR
jgi:hypothetical protein